VVSVLWIYLIMVELGFYVFGGFVRPWVMLVFSGFSSCFGRMIWSSVMLGFLGDKFSR
jgi:hypothetical protein